MGLFFFPRGGSAQVARALCSSLPQTGWDVTLAAGSLGQAGNPSHAESFFGGIDLAPVDYTQAQQCRDREPIPFPPSYEDRPGAPDRVFALIDDHMYERLVNVWARALRHAGAASASLLHLHHLTPINEAARRAFPERPVLGQLHGTELGLLRSIETGPASGWRFAERWANRLRGWARGCELVIVPPGAAGAEAARLLSLPADKLVPMASGADLQLFQRRPISPEQRINHWRRWLVEQPLGWDESGRPGTITYTDADLWPFRGADTVVLYVGRFTAVKRLPLLIRAHTRAISELNRPLPLVLVGGHPGEWEGEHPLAVARALGNKQIFFAGWRAHQQLPDAFNAADLLVLPSAGEAFGLVLVEAMACGLPVIATNSHGPAEIVADGTGWLIPTDDEAALARTLVLGASETNERRNRADHAHEHSHTTFGWATTAARTARLYDQIAASSQSAAVG